MKFFQKFKDFLWNDLPLRLSTMIIILIGIIPILFCYAIMANFILYGDDTLYSNGLGLFIYFYFVVIISTVVVVLLFISECVFKKNRLNFKIFQSKFFKILILLLYCVSIFSSYIIPCIIWLFGKLK